MFFCDQRRHWAVRPGAIMIALLGSTAIALAGCGDDDDENAELGAYAPLVIEGESFDADEVVSHGRDAEGAYFVVYSPDAAESLTVLRPVDEGGLEAVNVEVPQEVEIDGETVEISTPRSIFATDSNGETHWCLSSGKKAIYLGPNGAPELVNEAKELDDDYAWSDDVSCRFVEAGDDKMHIITHRIGYFDDSSWSYLELSRYQEDEWEHLSGALGDGEGSPHYPFRHDLQVVSTMANENASTDWETASAYWVGGAWTQEATIEVGPDRAAQDVADCGDERVVGTVQREMASGGVAQRLYTYEAHFEGGTTVEMATVEDGNQAQAAFDCDAEGRVLMARAGLVGSGTVEVRASTNPDEPVVLGELEQDVPTRRHLGPFLVIDADGVAHVMALEDHDEAQRRGLYWQLVPDRE